MGAPTPQHIRAFIAIALEPGWIAELKQVQRQFQSRLPEEAVRWVRPEQLHLTLRFLGQVSRESSAALTVALNQAVADIAPFRLALAGVGSFPDSKNPRVVWVGIKGQLDSLRRLQAQVETQMRGFGDHHEERIFQPHLTIGRVKAHGKIARSVGELVECAAVRDPGEMIVRQIHLVHSELAPEGARYTTLASAALIIPDAADTESPGDPKNG